MSKAGEESIRSIINIFDDAGREGLQDTPKRYLKFLKEFTNREEVNYTTFSSENYDQVIVMNEIPFYSLCEHHLAPFFGTASVAYLPDDKIVGLSKLARCVEYYASAFQNQERITMQVAERLMKELQPKGVMVKLTARHLCMEMRGVKKCGAGTTTSAMLGVFRDDASARNEVLNLLK